MRPTWDDVNARARGLGTHLLSGEQLEHCARQETLERLAEALRQAGVVTGALPPTPDATDLELAVRRWAATALGTLARWVGPRRDALPFVLAEVDRANLRAMLRGAAAGAPAEQRLAGTIPTPDLPERALEALAHAASAPAVVSLLGAWRHPVAAALAAEVGVAEPDLFRLEDALGRATIAQARRALRRARDPLLAEHVAETIDLANAVTAIMLTTEGADLVADDSFLPGGRGLAPSDFARAIATGDPASAARSLARTLAGSPCGARLERGASDPGGLEEALLRCQLQVVARRARMAPLGPIAVVHFVLRLRLQLLDLTRIIWAAAIGGPDHRSVTTDLAGVR